VGVDTIQLALVREHDTRPA